MPLFLVLRAHFFCELPQQATRQARQVYHLSSRSRGGGEGKSEIYGRERLIKVSNWWRNSIAQWGGIYVASDNQALMEMNESHGEEEDGRETYCRVDSLLDDALKVQCSARDKWMSGSSRRWLNFVFLRRRRHQCERWPGWGATRRIVFIISAWTPENCHRKPWWMSEWCRLKLVLSDDEFSGSKNPKTENFFPIFLHFQLGWKLSRWSPAQASRKNKPNWSSHAQTEKKFFQQRLSPTRWLMLWQQS